MSGPEPEMAVAGSSPAETWLGANPHVLERALEPAKATGKAPVDAFVSKPELVVEAVRSLVVQSVELDAPAGVAEELLPLLRPMVATLKERDLYQYSFDCVAQMEGLRDPIEFEPVLRAGAAGAPDTRNNAMLHGILDDDEQRLFPFRPIICMLCGEGNIITAIDKYGCPVCVAVFKLLLMPDVRWEPEPL